MVLYSYLHHSLEVQSAWIYLLVKQKPSVNVALFPAKWRKKITIMVSHVLLC